MQDEYRFDASGRVLAVVRTNDRRAVFDRGAAIPLIRRIGASAHRRIGASAHRRPVILQHASWRWLFLVNLPVGVPALVLAAWFLPGGREETKRRELDWVGLALLSLALVLFLYARNASTPRLASRRSRPPCCCSLRSRASSDARISMR